MCVERGCRVWRGSPTVPISVKSLTASSMSSVVLKGMLRVRRSVIIRPKKSKFMRRLLKRGGASEVRACVVRSSMTGEWSDDRSRLDVAAAEFGGIPLVPKSPKGRAVYFCQRASKWT
jgi:hypothetical protein